jgi:protein TonB
MSETSNARILRIALAASLAVHLIVAAVIYSRPVTAAPEPKPQKSYVIHLPPPTPTPPPRRPQPPHPQHHSVAVQPALHRVRLTAQTHVTTHSRNIAPPIAPSGEPQPGDTSGPIDAGPTAGPPAPAPTPKPACSAPDIPAKTLVTENAVAPDDAAGYSGEAKVQVDLDAAGNVVGASIYQSTGSMELDRAALAAARASRYAPEERDCKNVSGSYLFVVDFQQ